MDTSHSRAVVALLDSMIDRHTDDERLQIELRQVRSLVVEAAAAGDVRLLRSRLLSAASWARALLEYLDG